MSSGMKILLVYLALAVVCVLTLWIVGVCEARRRWAMRRVAESLGMRFLDRQRLVDIFTGYATRLARTKGRFSYTILGELAGRQLAVFDLLIVRGGDGTKTQTVAAIRAQLPPFEMRCRAFGDRLGRYPDTVDIAQPADFARQYTVRAPDAGSALTVLTPPVLAFLTLHHSDYTWAIESSGEWLFVYRDWSPNILNWRAFAGADWKVAPRDLPAFIKEAGELMQGILSPSPV